MLEDHSDDEEVVRRPLIAVKIDDKSQLNTEKKQAPATQGKKSSKSGTKDHSMERSAPNDIALQMKFELSGNNDLNFKEASKLGPRENRYGLYGDNGYAATVEIKKRKVEDEPKSQSGSLERKNEIRLSKEGLVEVINKISDYHKKKELEN